MAQSTTAAPPPPPPIKIISETPSVGNGTAMPERASMRDMQHVPARDYYRTMARPEPAPEGHLKYHIDKADFVPGCNHVWVPIRVNGMDSGQLRYYLAKGWVAARAMDFPRLSGYGVDYPEVLRRAGYVPNVQADDAIEIDGELLMLQAEELSAKAEEERIRDARELVDVQMRRLEMASRRSLGSKASDLMRMQYGKQYANPDSFDGSDSREL